MKIDPSIIISFLLFLSIIIWTIISSFGSPIAALFLNTIIELKILVLICLALGVVSYGMCYHYLRLEYPFQHELKGHVAISYIMLYAVSYIIGASLLHPKNRPSLY